MAWFILAIVIWGALMYLVGPLLKKQIDSPLFEKDIAAYQAEINRINEQLAVESVAGLQAQKLTLQRQLLNLTKTRGGAKASSTRWIINFIFAGFVIGGAGLYALLGSPNIKTDMSESINRAPTTPITNPETASVDEMLRILKQRLDTDRQDDPQGWIIYARTLVTEKRFDEAFAAYDRVLTLTNNDERVAAELERAKAFAANPQPGRPGPSQDDVDAAAQMSPEARAAMINNMVEGLADRLKESPEDVQGWIRLLKARTVLKQSDMLRADIATIKSIYSDRPDILAEIFTSADIDETNP